MSTDSRSEEVGESHKKRLVAWATIIGVWVGFASLGWIIGERSSPPGPQRATTLGGVSFAIPRGYELSSEPPEAVLEALGIGEPRTYGPTENVKEGAVVVGQGHGEGPELLSGRASANLQVRAGPLLERLGQDHIGVRSAGRLRVVEDGRLITRDVTVLALPAAGAVVYIVCLPASGSADSSLLEACERLATTIGLPAGFGTSLTVSELNGHTASVEVTLRRYEHERTRLRTDLAHARSTDAQRTLTEELAALCARTGRSLSGLPYDPLAASLQTRMLASLARCARAYKDFAQAIASTDRPAHMQADDRIYAADTALRQALKQASAP